MVTLVLNEQNEELIKEKEANLRYQTVQLEVDKLGKILLENKYQIKESNSQFWINHERLLPEFYKLATILLNIQSSSAFVERYLSICGIICLEYAKLINYNKIHDASKLSFIEWIKRTMLKFKIKYNFELNN